MQPRRLHAQFRRQSAATSSFERRVFGPGEDVGAAGGCRHLPAQPKAARPDRRCRSGGRRPLPIPASESGRERCRETSSGSACRPAHRCRLAGRPRPRAAVATPNDRASCFGLELGPLIHVAGRERRVSLAGGCSMWPCTPPVLQCTTRRTPRRERAFENMSRAVDVDARVRRVAPAPLRDRSRRCGRRPRSLALPRRTAAASVRSPTRTSRSGLFQAGGARLARRPHERAPHRSPACRR